MEKPVVGKKNKNRSKSAMTLLEMVIALAIMVIIIAVFAPQLKTINDSWASKKASAEVLQNARVFVDQINRSLSSADKIIDVSELTETNGYIEFEDNTGTVYRMDIAANNYIEFGPVGSLSDLAGPVSQLKITCYTSDDLDTPLDISASGVEGIRFVKAEVIFPNPGPGQDRTFTTSTYLRTNATAGTSGCLGWWKLDETSGLTANDSSGNDNHGTLNNMAGDEWTDGAIDGALEFNPASDGIVIVSQHSSINDLETFTLSAWVYVNNHNSYGRFFQKHPGAFIFSLGTDSDQNMVLTAMGWKNRGFWRTDNGTIQTGQWYHVAVTYDYSSTANDPVFYIDGVSVNVNETETPSGSRLSETSDLYFGHQGPPWHQYLDGILDDLRIYGRALTAEEIAGLANILRYCEFTEAKVSSDDTSITIGTPSGTSQDDLLIAAVATDGNTSSSLAPPFGQGWTEIDIGSYVTGVSLGAWWKNADASESPTHQFTWSGGEQAYGWMMLFNGHDTADPIDIYATGGDSSSTPTSPAVTTTVNDVLILRLGAFDESDITEDAPGLTGHTAITMDVSSGTVSKMYWYDEDVEQIQRANLDGSNIEALVTTGVTKIKALALDIAGGKMYWADEDVDKIQRANLDGSNIEDLVTAAVMKPRALALDIAGGKMYWADEEVDMIRRANLDGSNIEDLLYENRMKPRALALDIAGGKMYWADEEVDKIRRANLNGSSVEDLVSNVRQPRALALDIAGGKIYWADEDSKKIRRANLNGSSVEDLVSNVRQPRALALDIASGGSDSVSGGAGYVRQSSSGDSGTSSFALTASQDSRMITIGITPGPDGGGGGGEILP